MSIQEQLIEQLGPPTNIVCWLEGGYFTGMCYSIAYNKDHLLPVIEKTHFESPRANMAGVKILGITKQGPDDIQVVEHYKLMYFQEEPPGFAIYICQEDKKVWQAWENDPDTCVNIFKNTKYSGAIK